MKKLFILFSLLLFSIFSYSQTWLWAKAFTSGKNGGVDITRITTDVSGDIFVTGIYEDSVSFGAKYIKTNGAWGDPFLAKYDNNGDFQWVANANSNVNGADYALSLATDNGSNTYIAGQFNDTMSFGSFKLSSPNYNMFLVKYSTNGNLIWGIKTGLGKSKASSADAEDVTIDNSSNVYVTGKYTDTVVIGSDSLKDGGANGNIYVAKYDSSGKELWVQEGIVRMGSENLGGLAIAGDPYGNVYLYGTFNDSIRFGNNKLYTDYFHPNMFLVKYDSTGKIRWIRTCQLVGPNSYINNTQSDYSRPMTVDNVGHIYIGNLFLNGAVKLGTYSLTGGHYEDFFLAKYDTAGNVLWAKAYFASASPSVLYPYSLKADKMGHLYICGNIQDTANFNGFILTCDTTSEPSFLVKIDTSGNVICGTTITNYNDDQNAVVPDPLGDDVFFTGDAAFSSYCYFGNTSVAITANISEQGILGKWTCDALLGTADQTSEKQIILYPNPNNGLFQLGIKNGQLGIGNDVEIYNMLGERIYDAPLRQAQGDNTIDLSGKSAGVYLYRVVTEKGDLVGEGKFVIQ